MTSPLAPFHPVVQHWFDRTYGDPTPVQAKAWEAIARGDHVLATAPTGSGKTLAAFLWGLNQLLTGAWTGGATRVIYVSPLKALNNDIRRNLESPLAGLREAFTEAGIETPHVNAMTRSGDTPQRDRERMLRHAPEILITTPESLNLLLASARARLNLGSVVQVIIDEVHALAGNKRGTHLITAVDRLVPLSGEFQRVAMSASVRPVDAVARFIGGYTLDSVDPEPVYSPRAVRIVQAPQAKQYALEVTGPSAEERSEADSLWPSLTAMFRERLSRNRSTVLFVNSRRLCEKLTAMLNEGADGLLAYPHHGSLSRELRLLVEQRLKAGDLKAIVATSSLELGIDIGELDEVLMVQTPFNVVSALQRIGRAGHRVGEDSRGIMYPTHGADLLHAAVMTQCVTQQDIESVRPVTGALDVLTQTIASMSVTETWNLDALFAFIRTSTPYHELTRQQFDLVIEMLAGRYEDSRIRTLEPIVSYDRAAGTIASRRRTRLLVTMSGGTIPDRGYFDLRREDDGAKLGELDEEFVWERSIGHTIAFGNRMWNIRAITDNEVRVAPTARTAGEVPFWKADESDASHHFANRVAEFLEDADAALNDANYHKRLTHEHFLSPNAADSLIEFLKRQREATQSPLPHRHNVVAEHFEGGQDEAGARQTVIHTYWGGSVNRPFALALAQAYEEKFNAPLETFSNNECIVALLPHELGGRELFDLVPSSSIERLLRQKLERTGYFGARFRENAGRALLLPRRGFRKRMPLWMNRLRARKLMESTAQYADFPVLLETWRTCLRDIFETGVLAQRLDEIQSGTIAVSDCQTNSPSPFAQGVIWRQTNKHMYELDGALEGGPSRLDSDLIREAVHSAELRPEIPATVAETFTRKLQRTFPGYAPTTAQDFLDWVRERRFVPQHELEALRESIDAHSDRDATDLIAEATPQLVQVEVAGSPIGIAARDDIQSTLRAWAAEHTTIRTLDGDDVVLGAPRIDDQPRMSDWLADWLRFSGPLELDFLDAVLPVDREHLSEAIESLAHERVIVQGHLVAGETALQVCDAENLERLLRIVRRQAVFDDIRIPMDELPQRLAIQHGLSETNGDAASAIERLLGYPMPVGEVERAILPARISAYRGETLDNTLRESDAVWYGCGEKRIAFGLQHALHLFQDEQKEDVGESIIEDHAARYTFAGLMDKTGLDSPTLATRLWAQVWSGAVSNDTFEALRNGIATSFRPPKLPNRTKRITRGARHRWKLGRPETGHWFALPKPLAQQDAIAAEEEAMERARILLDRYGIVFRSLLAKEIAPFRWRDVFRPLRRMELASEVIAGSFIEGLDELQFATPAFVDDLRNRPPQDKVYWFNATDPVSPCGLNLPSYSEPLPRRIPSNTLVYVGTQLAIVSERNGAAMQINLDANDDLLERCFEFLLPQLSARNKPIRIKTVNGQSAANSAYYSALSKQFEVERGPNDLLILGPHPAPHKK